MGTLFKGKARGTKDPVIVPSAWSLAVLVFVRLFLSGLSLVLSPLQGCQLLQPFAPCRIYPVNNIVCDLDCNLNTSRCLSKSSVKQMLHQQTACSHSLPCLQNLELLLSQAVGGESLSSKNFSDKDLQIAQPLSSMPQQLFHCTAI